MEKGSKSQVPVASHADILLAHHAISPFSWRLCDEPKECLLGRLKFPLWDVMIDNSSDQGIITSVFDRSTYNDLLKNNF